MGEREGVVGVLNTYEQLVEGLPFSSDVNIAHITKLISPDESIGELNSKLIGRWAYLKEIHQDRGLDIQPEIDFGLAIALIDDEVFDIVVGKVFEDGEDKEVADHEIGHTLVAERLGWITNSVTIVPGSSYRGLTEAVPQGIVSFEDFALEFAAICYGGATAAAIMGNEVRGEGSDMAKAKALARAVVNNPYSKFTNEEGFLKQAQGLAESSLSSYGSSGIHRQAQRLFREKTMT